MALRAEAEALQAKVDGLAAELSSHRVAAAQASDRRKMARQNLERLERDTVDYQNRRAQLEAEVSADLLRAQTLSTDAEQLRGEAALLQGEASERARVHGERQGAVEERTARWRAERLTCGRLARGDRAGRKAGGPRSALPGSCLAPRLAGRAGQGTPPRRAAAGRYS